MDETVGFWLLLAALVIVVGLMGANFVLTLKLMGEVEKFGRLLLKVRRWIKAQSKAQ